MLVLVGKMDEHLNLIVGPRCSVMGPGDITYRALELPAELWREVLRPGLQCTGVIPSQPLAPGPA